MSRSRMPWHVSPRSHLPLLMILLTVGLPPRGWTDSEIPGPAEGGVRREPYRVGVLYWSTEIPGQVAMRRGVEDRAATINRSGDAPGVALVTRVAGEGERGIENQIRQMDDMLALDPPLDLIIVQPTDNAALAGPLRRANERGIPVVAYDQYISGGRLACYLTSDNFQAGYLNGEYVAWRFPDDRPLRIVLVEYPHVSSTVERVNGFLDALGHLGQPYRILATFEAVEPVGGRRAGLKILEHFPDRDSLDLVFCVNDGAAWRWWRPWSKRVGTRSGSPPSTATPLPRPTSPPDA
ncbi:MAG: sugar ABC transporter substrate-binding protein [Candidatus Krumholzibacteriia bacterium]